MTPAEKKELTRFLKRGDKKEICRLAGVHETVMYAWMSGRLKSSSIEPYVIQFANRRKKELAERTGKNTTELFTDSEMIDRENLLLKSELKLHQAEISKYLRLIAGKNKVLRKLFATLKSYILHSVTDPEHSQALAGHIDRFETDYAFLNHYEKYVDVLDSINPIFEQSLERLRPGLSAMEKRLLSFLKLNLSTYEISLILAVSEATIRKKTALLKRKLRLEPEESLSDFINMLTYFEG